MVPRATAQQAVDLLKIYQLRRENALIYEQVQDLSEAVKGLSKSCQSALTSNTKCKAEIDIIGTSVTKQQTGLTRVESTIQTLQADQKISTAQTSEWQEQSKLGFQNLRLKQNSLLQTVELAQDRCDQRMQMVEVDCHGFSEQLVAINEVLKSTAKEVDLQSLHDRLEILMKQRAGQLQEQDSISRIKDSFNHYMQDRNVTQSDQDMNDLCSIATEPIDCGISGHVDTACQLADVSCVPDDIDLDEADGLVNNSACLILASPHKPRGSAPIPKPQKASSFDELLVYQQAVGENVASYLDRGLTAHSRVPPEASDILLRRLIEGITDDQNRKTHRELMEERGWSWDIMKDIIASKSGEQSPAYSTAALRTRGEEMVSSDHAATIEVSRAPQAFPLPVVVKSQIINAGNHIDDAGPRRSRRIAERLEKDKATASLAKDPTSSPNQHFRRVTSKRAKPCLKKRSADGAVANIGESKPARKRKGTLKSFSANGTYTDRDEQDDRQIERETPKRIFKQVMSARSQKRGKHSVQESNIIGKSPPTLPHGPVKSSSSRRFTNPILQDDTSSRAMNVQDDIAGADRPNMQSGKVSPHKQGETTQEHISRTRPLIFSSLSDDDDRAEMFDAWC